MRIFDFDNYQDFLNAWLQDKPRGGYGQLAKIAKGLGISPSIVTLVLKGEKDFTFEQAADLAVYFGLTEMETDYLLALVGFARAGNENLRRKFGRQINRIKEDAKDLKRLLPPQKELTEEAKAIFYSQWHYSAIRNLTSIECLNSVEKLTQHLGLPRGRVKGVVDFLLLHGLCVENNGKLRAGPQSTHLGANSPLVARHHINWRERAIFHAEKIREDELFFTSPLSLSADDFPKVRAILVKSIEEVFRVVDPSPSETAACINIDWFMF